MILLAGVPHEPPLALVMAALEARGAPHLLFDQGQAGSRVVLEGSHGGISGLLEMPDGACIRLEEVRGCYTRMVDHRRLPAWRDADPAGRAGMDAANAAVNLFMELAPCRVLNRAAAMASNRSKPFQSQLIQSFGFDVPQTLVTNDPVAAREFRARHGRVVFKSISGLRSIVTEWDDAVAARLEMIRACPVQFQALAEGLDVRVHVVGKAIFATACRSEVVDYRYAGRVDATTTLEPYMLPEAVAARCFTLAHALELPLCGIDLKHTPDGRWVCFEANPSPGFSWFEQAAGQPIAAAIALLLIDT